MALGWALVLAFARGGALLSALAGPGAALAAGEGEFLALQASRQVQRVPVAAAAGAPPAEVELTQLAPAVNAWLLLSVPAPDGRGAQHHHLENADPQGQRVTLDPAAPGTLLIRSAAGIARCVLWPGPALARAAALRQPFGPLCGGRLFLRTAVPGHRTALEATTGFLRDHVWGGERIIAFVKREFYRDAFVERAASGAAAAGAAAPAIAASAPGGAAGAAPPAARLLGGETPRAVLAPGLGIGTVPPGPVWQPGAWSRAAGLDGIWVSVAPQGVLAGALDAVESQALAYLVAFDLATYELGFALGAEHPRLGWSPRALPPQRPAGWPGPDGFDSAAPLVRTGMLAPTLLPRVAATFTGGFKREHGAFRHGALAAVNRGSHYGFIEQGVVFSRLQPGLATLLVQADGTVDMRTWRAPDEAPAGTLRHARQNGVPLVETGSGGRPAVGALVSQWGAGNWSGSADERLRTLRAGACLLVHEGRRFLVYGYFSSATPAAMARAFLAYGCRYAMHLDMNALEHTYLALYPHERGVVGVEHLVPGMAVLDKTAGAALLPRFLAFGDDRDFFYLIRKAAP